MIIYVPSTKKRRPQAGELIAYEGKALGFASFDYVEEYTILEPIEVPDDFRAVIEQDAIRPPEVVPSKLVKMQQRDGGIATVYFRGGNNSLFGVDASGCARIWQANGIWDDGNDDQKDPIDLILPAGWDWSVLDEKGGDE